MTKSGVNKAGANNKQIEKILITQPRPESEKSPYFELSRKYDVQMDFHPFIKLEGIPARDFRKQKIEIQSYTGVIFTSRNAIDHFFRICEEMKVSISQDTKYFCITEAVALYLQKFILYRKRKVFRKRSKRIFEEMILVVTSKGKYIMKNNNTKMIPCNVNNHF